MNLRDFVDEYRLVRDGTFDYLGYPEDVDSGLLCFANNMTFLRRAQKNPNLTSVIVTPELVKQVPRTLGTAFHECPRQLFYEIHKQLIGYQDHGVDSDSDASLIHPSAVISDEAQIGVNVRIGPHCVVGPRVRIGDHSVLQPGCQVGVDGLLHYMNGHERHLVPHGGTVEIGRNVVLMSHAVVVSGIFSRDCTFVGDSTIIGIHSTIGHNVRVGKESTISNNALVARSAKLGVGVFLGSGSVVSEYLHIGDRARVLAGSVVVTDVVDDEIVAGNFAVSQRRHFKSFSER